MIPTKVPSKRRTPTFIEQNLDILGRLASLEHFSNQQSILLDAVLSILENAMAENTNTKSFTWEDITGEKP